MTTCAHHPCSCPIGEHVRYCSDYCRNAADGAAVAEAFDMAVCSCGHAGCTTHHEHSASERAKHAARTHSETTSNP